MRSHAVAERMKCCPMTPLGEDNGKFAPAPSRALLHAPLSLAGFNLYPFTVINHNHKYSCFSKFCESFQWIIKSKGYLRVLLHRYQLRCKSIGRNLKILADGLYFKENQRLLLKYFYKLANFISLLHPARTLITGSILYCLPLMVISITKLCSEL